MKPEDEVYPLGDDDIELLAGYQREGAMLQGRMAGVLDSFIRRHKLQGRWELSPNGREIRRPEVQPQWQPDNPSSTTR